MGPALVSTILAAIIATGLVALLGFILLWFGLRGRRINDHPLCRKCRFDLIGLNTPEKCPECGADLQRPRAIRIGERRKRPRVLVIAALLLLAVFAVGGVVGWGAAKSYDWNRIKPVWLLVREGSGSNAAQADAALKELRARQINKRLSPAQAHSVVLAALQFQMDQSLQWRPRWGDLVELEQLAGRLGDEDCSRYCRNAVVPEFRVRRKVIPGSPVPIALHVAYRVGTRRIILCEANMVRVAIGSQALPTGFGFAQSPDCTPGTRGDAITMPLTIRRDPFGGAANEIVFNEPGSQTADLVWQFRVGLCTDDKRDIKGPATTWNHTETITVFVVPEAADVIETSDKPSARAAVRASIGVIGIEQGPTVRTKYANFGPAPTARDQATHTSGLLPLGNLPAEASLARLPDQSGKAVTKVSVDLFAINPPIPFAFDVVLSNRQRQWFIGRFHSESTSPFSFGRGSTHLTATLDDFAESVVDIMLIPSPAAARESTSITRMWGEPVVIESMPVQLSNSRDLQP